ncbi:MAG: phosphoserine phosphatase RsbU/P [Phycisphaerales bacterium]|jgi:sigma-B regulation protein RsbU (phosphoserine phosphatase)|nr:phosphoserine phosphatase RsbU/P [Phycisphaerales bacterium]
MTRTDPSRVGTGAWQERLKFVIETVREMSAQTDPQRMVETYSNRVRQVMPVDGTVSLSRRGYQSPDVRVTRASIWTEDVNPWKQRDGLVIHHGGLFSKLIYADEPTVIDELQVPADDPAAPFVAGMRSAMAIPLFDQGVALNMVILFRREPAAFERESLPERVWLSNLFGRATHNLVLSEQLREAYDAVDRELQVVADIQRSLLPAELPRIPGVELAVHYRTSKHAGGDYYDFFPLPDGRWGILIADVSGHGTPAAVLMAVTHSIAHTHDGPPAPPAMLLDFVNRHLAARYTNGNGTFVTAFYGIYDPGTREMVYASAGHPPPRVRRGQGRGADARIESAFAPSGLPLGIDADERYADGVVRFEPGDLLLLYTDGITEARGPGTADFALFGYDRLDAALAGCAHDAGDALTCVLRDVDHFTGGAAPSDDQTLMAAAFTSDSTARN